MPGWAAPVSWGQQASIPRLWTNATCEHSIQRKPMTEKTNLKVLLLGNRPWTWFPIESWKKPFNVSLLVIVTQPSAHLAPLEIFYTALPLPGTSATATGFNPWLVHCAHWGQQGLLLGILAMASGSCSGKQQARKRTVTAIPPNFWG